MCVSQESDYFTEHGEFRVDAEGSPTLLNSLMYKLSYYRFGELKLDYRSPAGYDRTRNAVIGNKDFKLTYLEEAYTTEHWLVRIYRYVLFIIFCLCLENINRDFFICFIRKRSMKAPPFYTTNCQMSLMTYTPQ